MERSDLDAVLAIEQDAYPNPWKLEHFIQELHSPLAIPFVAVQDQTVIGYLCLMSLFEEAQILNVAVARLQRGKGIARLLMDTAIRTARERGAELLTLEVRESNRAAIALYESYGFVRYFVRRGYYEGTEDAILMEKTLL
ncbi:ribosomal-protein-alanine acetyltransferase [Geobacter sp. SVR]|nr:ribosomal-protein-alanine acetyltransferase [Geobacter sp. SVR]GCF85463.1 ribosomal-protein-alanine acetyltransferase [Geobacter sp. SVR]